jgi:PleD family two-component response regulator
VLGEYTIRIESGTRKFKLNAAIGLSEWIPGEPVAALIARADKNMYDEKTRQKAAAGQVTARR